MILTEPPKRHDVSEEPVGLLHPVRFTVPLPDAIPQVSTSLVDAFGTRQSSAGGGRLSLAALAGLLSLCCRSRSGGSRPYPSAGALYAIEMLAHGIETHEDLYRYEPRTHELQALDVPTSVPRELRAMAGSCLPREGGTCIWFVADPERLAGRYCAGESLLWREAGVLTGLLSLGAHGLGLRATPMGVTGEPAVSQMSWSSPAYGVGGLAVWPKAELP